MGFYTQAQFLYIYICISKGYIIELILLYDFVYIIYISTQTCDLFYSLDTRSTAQLRTLTTGSPNNLLATEESGRRVIYKPKSKYSS